MTNGSAAAEMTTEDLAGYVTALLARSTPLEAAEIGYTYSWAVRIARLVEAGMVHPDGITDEGRDQLADLYNDLENGGG